MGIQKLGITTETLKRGRERRKNPEPVPRTMQQYLKSWQ